MVRKVSSCSLFLILSLSLVFNAISLKTDQPSGSWFPNKQASLVRGGVLKKKGHSALESSDSTTVANLEERKTSVHTQSSVVHGTSNVDTQYKRALVKTAFTVCGAVAFGISLMATRGVTSGYEFFAGYLIEQSLSIDNLFVFIMLFEYFNIPNDLQNRVLTWGITGAIVLRGLMIGVGVAALQKFKSVILIFAVILMGSSINLLLEKETDEGGQHEENLVMKFTRSLFPNTSSELHGEKFFIVENGKRIATPLFLCLIAVELSDFVFAVDSIPAVLGVSKDPLIVYASNIFAILALRSLYTVVAKAVSSFKYLKPAVALVLGFVGSKMVAEYFHIEIGTGVSLAVICSLLGTGIIASIIESERKQRENFVAIDSSTVTNSTITLQ
jgi:TerC family integral membrane protein